MGITGAFSYLGSIATDRGDCAAAGDLYRESIATGQEIGAQMLIAGSLADLSHLAAPTGDARWGVTLLEAAPVLILKVIP